MKKYLCHIGKILNVFFFLDPFVLRQNLHHNKNSDNDLTDLEYQYLMLLLLTIDVNQENSYFCADHWKQLIINQ